MKRRKGINPLSGRELTDIDESLSEDVRKKKAFKGVGARLNTGVC